MERSRLELSISFPCGQDEGISPAGRPHDYPSSTDLCLSWSATVRSTLGRRLIALGLSMRQACIPGTLFGSKPLAKRALRSACSERAACGGHWRFSGRVGLQISTQPKNPRSAQPPLRAEDRRSMSRDSSWPRWRRSAVARRADLPLNGSKEGRTQTMTQAP